MSKSKKFPSIQHHQSFINDTCDKRISQILKQHGWSQLSSKNSDFKIKWSWKVNLGDIQNLSSNQAYNHFKNSEDITTKLGLMTSLRKNFLISDQGKNYCNYYPRSYNLQQQNTQKDEIIEDFIKTGIFNLLKKIIACLEIYYPQQYTHLKKTQKKLLLENTHLHLTNLLRKRKIFTKKNYEKFIINQEIYMKLLVYLENVTSLDSNYQIKQVEKLELLRYSQLDIPYQSKTAKGNQRNSISSENPDDNSEATPSTKSLILLMHYYMILSQNKTFYSDGFSNIWIIKSSHSSRGRGIKLVDNLESIQQNNNGMKIIQKYVENIWVLQEEQIKRNFRFLQKKEKFADIMRIVNKKFDIRLWVFVKSCSPLQIYFYDEGYLRITSRDYQLNSLQNFNAHLTNYSVNWPQKNKQITDEKAQTQSYLLLSYFYNFIEEIFEKSTKQLKNKIDNIIIDTIKSADLIGPKGSFQLFGFDIILDGNLEPWLLECNMSPACEDRGHLSKIYRQMITGLFSLQGACQSSTYQWKILYREQKLPQFRESLISNNTKYSQFLVKQNRSLNDSKEKNQLQRIQMIRIGGNRINVKKYFMVERYHEALEKIVKIQRFFRKKIRQKENNYEMKKYKNNVRKSLSAILLQVKNQILKPRASIPQQNGKSKESASKIKNLIKLRKTKYTFTTKFL